MQASENDMQQDIRFVGLFMFSTCSEGWNRVSSTLHLTSKLLKKFFTIFYEYYEDDGV